MNTKKYIGSIVAMSAAGILSLALPMLAAACSTDAKTAPQNGTFNSQLRMAPIRGQMQGVFGTVSAVDATAKTITVNGQQGFNATASTVPYVVNVGDAKITKTGVTAPSFSDLIVGDTVSVQGTVSGQNVTNVTGIRDGIMAGRGRGGFGMQGISGTVASAPANNNGIYTFTVTGKQGFGSTATTTTTYSVTADSTTVKVTKDNAASDMTKIALNDTVFVSGTVSGANVTATAIRDGAVPARGQAKGTKTAQTPENLAITGNGQPVVAGTVTGTVTSTGLSITNKSNVTYAITIDPTNTKIVQGQNTIGYSQINPGDSVVVQGTFTTATTVNASSIIDQTKPANTTTTATGSNQGNHFGFLGNIGQFFMHLFGF